MWTFLHNILRSIALHPIPCSDKVKKRTTFRDDSVNNLFWISLVVQPPLLMVHNYQFYYLMIQTMLFMWWSHSWSETFLNCLKNDKYTCELQLFSLILKWHNTSTFSLHVVVWVTSECFLFLCSVKWRFVCITLGLHDTISTIACSTCLVSHRLLKD